MSDDFRVRIELSDGDAARELADKLGADDLEHQLEAEFHDRVVVSVDDAEVFAYAGSRGQAQRVQELVGTLSQPTAVEIQRWHPVAEAWEDPDKPLPESDEAMAAEHAERIARERAQSEEQGFNEYEVRVTCRSHGETVKLAEVLRLQHLPVVRRWRYLLVAASDEDSAQALANRITQEAPPGSTVTVEANPAGVPRRGNPFAFLGGFGG
jgi:hypothetical protein